MSYDELIAVLLSDKPSDWIRNNEDLVFNFIPELRKCKGFNQKNEWHVYDVYEHILHVVDNVDNDIYLRIAALFHDIGKPNSYKEDENGVGHFFGHWDESIKIFGEFAERNNLDDKTCLIVSKLIYFHDMNFGKFDEEKLDEISHVFTIDELIKLYDLKRADLLAQNEKYHYLLDDYVKQKTKILERYSKN